MQVRNFTLYQLSAEFQLAFERLLNGEITKEEFDACHTSFENKCINVSRYILNLEAEYEAVKNAAKNMSDRAKSISTEIERKRHYLQTEIEACGLAEPIKCDDFVIKWRKNPPSLVVTNAELIPDYYRNVEQVISINNKLLKQDILDGFAIEGAHIEQNKKLVIS